jgi:hypothetical protein
MKKDKKKLSESLTMDYLVGQVRNFYAHLSDHRAKNVKFKLVDVLMSGYAMFSQKCASLLEFEQQTVFEKSNIKNLYGIEGLYSDTQVRAILDEVSPESLYPIFGQQITQLEEKGGLLGYQVLGDYLIASIDGVEFFHSCKVGCKKCLHKKHRNGEVSNSHSMLACSLVHPNKREVFPLGCEFIEQQDGRQKNDCELNAAKRLKSQLKADYPDKKLLIVEDALYGTEPNIQQIADNQWAYIIGVKPGSHAAIFSLFEGRRSRNQLNSYEYTDEKGIMHRFSWMNNIALNHSSKMRTNFLYYEQQDKKGNTTVFSWITSLDIRKRTVITIMKIGRSRWKIENETFNTLKNQGYHFEHNYGHGFNHLCNVFALLMLTTFLIDQIVQSADKIFQKVEKEIKTKARFWQDMRALFRTSIFLSFKELFCQLAFLHRISLKGFT